MEQHGVREVFGADCKFGHGALKIDIDEKAVVTMDIDGQQVALTFETTMAMIGRLNEVAGFLTADMPGTSVSRIAMLREGKPGVWDGCP